MSAKIKKTFSRQTSHHLGKEVLKCSIENEKWMFVVEKYMNDQTNVRTQKA